MCLHVIIHTNIKPYLASLLINSYTVNREIFNGNKFLRLAKSTKNYRMKIYKQRKFITRVPIIASFAWHNLVVYLLIIYGLLRFQAKFAGWQFA